MIKIIGQPQIKQLVDFILKKTTNGQYNSSVVMTGQ